ncbi:Lrp/AsnC family transcriptional regulator [Aeromonas salmonicida]|uniref:Lrp/AsnC family transcriptional regulator n=1 Tax=Aeromonas salmonicida TaxID=645 RepID=UPI000A113F5C|nr:Lrp/AsnC family transcriptional regulator [Aeromonas salmonicida]ORJ13133.1 AsnC family transcriptional regulator [Aeromonas salmonicida]ORJ18492.1 AsnC family transcriptional regulator [Aeromonas salmonicida]WCH30862.1 Lrp/AsnC family transcriptional regulator [Aeromonas salmonicida]WCH35060.1 Lrp/AsnC family transcriptional regulator [Aeromonas salmonicida]
MLDRIDLHLLRLLQQDGRLSTVELAEQVGLSASPCARRLRRLEGEGHIQGYRAVLAREKLGLGITIFVNVRLSQHKEPLVDAFEQAVAAMAEVINCHTVSGNYDYLLEVVVPDLPAYEQWIRRLQSQDMVNDISCHFAIRAVKVMGPLPI